MHRREHERYAAVSLQRARAVQASLSSSMMSCVESSSSCAACACSLCDMWSSRIARCCSLLARLSSLCTRVCSREILLVVRASAFLRTYVCVCVCVEFVSWRPRFPSTGSISALSLCSTSLPVVCLFLCPWKINTSPYLLVGLERGLTVFCSLALELCELFLACNSR